jgi:hypothetical protein
VHGRDEELLSRLPSAAEPMHATYQFDDILDFSSNRDEPILNANIKTEWNEEDDNDLADFISSRLALDLSPFDWISDDDENTCDPPTSLSDPFDLPTPTSDSQPEHTTKTPTYALSAVDAQINELGILKTEFYDRLRTQNANLLENVRLRAHFDGGSMATTQLSLVLFSI